ncbi:MAG TPA: hypothetical protein DCO68_12070 [Methylophilaceae bacterium]|nr:hypothetical protein [Methylophilaceae bacterium]HAJ72801.1 hypothetical protein [Methylophilaceae bacterium]
MNYSERLKLLHAICVAETYADGAKPHIDLADYHALDAANYLASFITFRAIQNADRHPAEELKENFDMLSVYQAYAMLIYAFLTMPLTQEEIAPNFNEAQIIIAKTLFAGISDEQLAEIIESGLHKFKLIGDADVEHWSEYRENLDKVTVSFVIAGSDDESPHSKEEVLPLFGQLLSQLCEAFTIE